MGRAGGPPSGRSGERSKKIGQVRTKRKKRKRDLEELHRNVLEAKRCARVGATQHRTKPKTNFAKVLSNFADKRRDNEEGKETFGDGKPRRKKSRTICDRLLPEPMVGLYQNGAKGREIRRATGRLNEMNVARLRGNVLKLLKGDETNVKSSREREEDEKEERANPDHSLDDSDQSDCQIVKSRRVKDGPILGNTKGVAVVKRPNREGLRTSKVRGEEASRIETRDEATELPPRQRDEDKCRRRLFEPDDDEDEPTKNSFGIIDRPMITDHEIRFSPRRIERVPCAKDPKVIDDREKRTVPRNDKSRNDEENGAQRNRANDRASINANFWGRSPVTCYERLCAEISIQNFEDKPYHRQRDPIVKLQKTIRGLFIQNGRGLRDNPKKLSRKPEEPGSVISWKAMGGSTSEEEIYQACTGVSDMEQCSSADSSVTMIGSWHPECSQHHPSNDDTASVFDDDQSMQATSKRTRKPRETKPKSPSNGNEKNDATCSADVVEKTISSVSAFLKQFQDHKPLTGHGRRNIFDMEIDGESGTSGEKLDVCLETPPQGKTFPSLPKCALRKNTIKHVPAILRRSAEHSDRMDQDENPRGFLPARPVQRIPKQRIPDAGNSIFSALQSFPAQESGARSIDDMAVSPCATSILREANYYHYPTPGREAGKEPAELRQPDRANARKSKLNFTRASNNQSRRLSCSEDHEAKGPQGTDYEDPPADRQVEVSRRDFSKIVTANKPTSKNRPFRQDPPETTDFHADPRRHSEVRAEQAIPGKRVTFFNESDGFFDPSEWKNAERFELDAQRRRNDRDARIKAAERNLVDHPRNHRRNNQCDDARCPSFEFPPPEVDRRRSNDPKSIAEIKHLPGNPQDPMLPFSQVGNATESLGLGNDDAMSRARPLIVTGPGASMWHYADPESVNSEQPVQGLSSLRTLGNQWPIYGNPPPCDGPNGGSVHEHQRALSRRPVVLFRPIEHPRQRAAPQSQNPDPRNHDNHETTAMREAVRNLRVMAFEDNIPEERPSRRSNHASYQQPQQQRSSPPRCSHQSWREGQSSNQLSLKSLESYAQPAKFLAYERTEGGNPGRIPIYGKFYVPNVPTGKSSKRDASELLVNTDDEAQPTGSFYVSSVQAAGPSNERKPANGRLVERTTGSFILTAGRSYVCDNDSTVLVRSESELSGMERQSRRVALMMPLPPLRYRQSSKIARPTASPAKALETAISNDVPAGGIVYSLDDRGRLLRPAELRYGLVESPVTAPNTVNRLQSQCGTNINLCGRPFTEAASMPERIRLPDGRIGLLLAENSAQRFDTNARPAPNVPSRINGPDSTTDARCLYEFTNNDGVHYTQLDRRRNTGYDANEAYRR